MVPRFRPPPAPVAWASQDVGAGVAPLTADCWLEMLWTAGLQDIVVRTFPLSVRNEAKEMLQRYGGGGMLGIFGKMLALYARNPAYRRFVRDMRESGVAPPNLDEYFGYGLYVGRK